jgi:hypothetical protein
MSKAIDFRCTGCSAPLEIPKNLRGSVKCPFCGVECRLENNNKNAEIVAKENINSGIPLSATPLLLHNVLVEHLCQAPHLPVDIFEKAEVIRDERYYVPAYCFYCNSMASFTYEVGVNRSETYTVGYGKNRRIQTRTVTEWSPNSNMVSASPTVFASGNRKMFDQIKELYISLSPKKLIDVEELTFPEGVETLNYDFPESASFSEKVAPYVNELLRKQAESTVAKLNTRNKAMSGSNVQKESTRVLLGLYKVVFTYDGKEYYIWVTGNGENSYHEGIPEDLIRAEALKEMRNRHAEMIKSHRSAFAMTVFLAVITCGIYLLASSALKDKRARDEQRIKSQQEIREFEAVSANIKEQFKAQNKRLKGIYESA